MPQVGEHGGHGCVDVRHVRRPRLGLRCAHADEMDLGSLNGGEVLSEGQASGLHVTGQKPFQLGLEERRPAVTQKIYLVGVDVHAHHVMPELRH